MADVFENRIELDDERRMLWALIEETAWLDWLLLTKRPQNVVRMVPWKKMWPRNVWLGVSVENQVWASHRIPILLTIPAAARFLSCEPLLGPIDLTGWTVNKAAYFEHKIDWVVAGGESGHKARPLNPDWIRALRDQCADASIPFHFKQWGHWQPVIGTKMPSAKVVTMQGDGGKEIKMVATGKKAAGRILDGRKWSELPTVISA